MKNKESTSEQPCSRERNKELEIGFDIGFVKPFVMEIRGSWNILA